MKITTSIRRFLDRIGRAVAPRRPAQDRNRHRRCRVNMVDAGTGFAKLGAGRYLKAGINSTAPLRVTAGRGGRWVPMSDRARRLYAGGERQFWTDGLRVWADREPVRGVRS